MRTLMHRIGIVALVIVAQAANADATSLAQPVRRTYLSEQAALARPLPFAEINAGAPSGVTTIPISGLTQLSAAEFGPTSLVTANTQPMHVSGADADPSSRYAAPFASGRQFVLFQNPSTPSGIDTGITARAFVVELTTTDAPGATLYAGVDSNDDGRPQQSEEVCQSSTVAGSGIVARCAVSLDFADDLNVWVLVDVPQGVSGATYSMSLASGFPFIGSLVPNTFQAPGVSVTGPGHVPAGGAFPLRLRWGPAGGNMPLVAKQRYFGAVLIASKGDSDLAGTLPFSLVYAGGNEDLQDALSSSLFYGRYDATGPATFRHLYVDIPPGATTLEIDSGLTGSASPSASVTFSLVQTDFPAFSASAQVAPAPDKAPVATWNLTSTTPTHTTNVPVTRGRWYVVAQTSGATGFTLSTTLSDDTPVGPVSFPTPPGAYYNPQRSGHGIFVSQASGQQAVDWYTYLEDGTPTWYQAQAEAPTTSAWSASLYRVSWDGAKVNTRVVVGDVTLTPIDASDLIFSWHLDGQSGSERFTRLGAGPCPILNGVATNLNGAWYASAQSGYGMDVVALSDLQFAAFYFYDDLGIARWGSGATAPFAANSAINLSQNHGFCPVCDYVTVTTQPLGTLAINYSGSTAGTYATTLALRPPLSGAWSINQPMVRLTGTAGCSP